MTGGMGPVQPCIVTRRGEIQEGVLLENAAPGQRNVVTERVLVPETHARDVPDPRGHGGDGFEIGDDQVDARGIEGQHVAHEPGKIELEHGFHVVHPALVGHQRQSLHDAAGRENLNLLQLLLFSAADDHLDLVAVLLELSDQFPAAADMAVSRALDTEKDLHAALRLRLHWFDGHCDSTDDFQIGVLHHQRFVAC